MLRQLSDLLHSLSFRSALCWAGMCLMICLVVPHVFADDFYVDAYYGCDETGDGSQETPWQHLQFALDAIEGTEENPHTVHLAKGIYQRVDDIGSGIRPGDYITIIGECANETMIPLLWGTKIQAFKISNVTIQKISIQHQENFFVHNCSFLGGRPGATISIRDFSEIMFTNCSFYGADYVFQIANNSTVTAKNCIFANYNQMVHPSSTSDPFIMYSLIKSYHSPGVGNIINEFPRFVRPDAFDYRLRSDSPAIDSGDPSDPVPPGGGSRIDMGCHEYPYAPVLFIESVSFSEMTGNQNGIPELDETIQPVIRLCNYGEPATDLTITFELDHPDITMESPEVVVGMLEFDECRDISGPVFSVTDCSGWGLPAELYGDWTDGEHTGRLHIPMTLHGVDFYIDPETGSDDAGDGSPDAPYLTIAHARNQARGSRLHRVTLRPQAGTYSESTNGESWPLWLDEYEDLKGEGRDTVLYNDTMESGIYFRPSRTANLSDFSVDKIGGGIQVLSPLLVTYNNLYSGYYGFFGHWRVTVENCDCDGVLFSGTIPGNDALAERNCILSGSSSGGAVFQYNEIGPNSFTLYQHENYPHGHLPGNVAMHNVISAPTTIKNANVFSNNICTGVIVTTDVPVEISQNVTSTSMVSLDSNETVTFSNNIGIGLSYSGTFGVTESRSASFRNCISLSMCLRQSGYNFNGWLGGLDVDGCVGLLSSTGVNYRYCWQTRNSVLYYLSEDNSACINTQYSDLMNCPEPTNIDVDPGFIGIATITSIGENWFSDDTAAWEPDRYAGYYVNPNILNNKNLFYCIGNTADTVYVLGDPRVAAQVGDLFVIPDLRLRRISDGFAFDSPLINAGDPDVLNPDGSRRDIGAYGGPYALTPMPVIPTWPPPDQTPTPVPTSTPSAPPTFPDAQTATPTPLVTGVTITMPTHHFKPSDTCYCLLTVTNSELDALDNNPLFLILDVYGGLFFGPSFTHDADWYPGPWPTGDTCVEAIPAFIWPETGTSATGIFWYAALTDPALTQIVGEWDAWEFGWE